MIRNLLLSLAVWYCTPSVVQAQQVPSKIDFAGMELRLNDAAIKDIQADVDALTRSETYFQKKLQRVDMYMPIIERIFKEEGLPDDFKYLVIQESALVSDAVSSSNAVGFWQFKEISGLENGLRIDNHVDERMNIVASTRAAATYLKSHNFFFDNWAHSLIAYQTGRGGAQNVIDSDDNGSRKMKITSGTYWYLKKYLAHKVAFESVLGTADIPYHLKEVNEVQGKSVKEIAQAEGVDHSLVEEYNKWLRKGRIPTDKDYTVIIPLEKFEAIDVTKEETRFVVKNELPHQFKTNDQERVPDVYYPSKSDRSIAHLVEINGLKGIYAPQGYTMNQLAKEADLDQYKLRKYNDLSLRVPLITDRIYYLQHKRNRAKFYYHTVEQGETTWSISQRYGLKLKKLLRKNRMSENDILQEGRVLWLRYNRPSDVAIEYRTPPAQKNSTPIKDNTIDPVIAQEAVQKETEITSSTAVLPIMDSIPNQYSITNVIKLDSASSGESKEVQKNDSTLGNLSVGNTLIDSLPTTVDYEDSLLQVEEPKETDTIAFIEQDSLQRELFNEIEKVDPETGSKKNQLMTYSIKKGDTFFAIANKFNMRISELLEFNQLNIRDTLSIGQMILVNKMEIPEATATKQGEAEQTSKQQPEPVVVLENQQEKTFTQQHKVKPGDTMYALAKTYSVSIKDIMEWNDKSDYSLKEGEIILIKKK